MAGIEPALSCSRSRRIPAFPHPENRPREGSSARRESNPHFRHGEAIGYRYNMGTRCRRRIVKESEGTGWGSNPRRRISGAVFLAAGPPVLRGLGPEGLEPSPAWLRARGSAARALVPRPRVEVGPGGVEPPFPGYQPGVLPLNYGPVGLSPPDGAGGIRTPTSRFKRPGCCRYTTAPRVAGKAGPIVYQKSCAYPREKRSVRAAGFEPAVSSPPSLRIARLSHALMVATDGDRGSGP